MSNNIFRQKSLERIASPEQLNEYIRVSTPSVWLVLCAVILLLVGVCVWGVFGQLDTVLPLAAQAEGGVVTAYVRETEAASLKEGMAVSLDGEKGMIVAIAPQPVMVDETFADYVRHLGGLQLGEWVYPVALDVPTADGIYTVQVVLESVAPMSFVLN